MKSHRYQSHKTELLQNGFRLIWERADARITAFVVRNNEFAVLGAYEGVRYRGYSSNKEHFITLNPALQFIFDYFKI